MTSKETILLWHYPAITKLQGIFVGKGSVPFSFNPKNKNVPCVYQCVVDSFQYSISGIVSKPCHYEVHFNCYHWPNSIVQRLPVNQ